MKRTTALIAILAFAFTCAAVAGPASSRGHHPKDLDLTEPIRATVPIDLLRTRYSQGELEAGTYVGDEFCISCHTWARITRDVKHKQALRTPMGANSLIDGKGVVADYDQNGMDDFMQGLDFNTIDSVFDPYKPNAPILSYNAGDDTYWMTIGPLTVQVWITQGGTGDWKQRYLVRVPVGGGLWARDMYVSPVQYNEATDEYVLYHPEHWWNPETFAPILPAVPNRGQVGAVGRSYSKRCIGCHTAGIRNLFQDAVGEWVYKPYPASLIYPDNVEQYPDYDQDGIPDLVNIGCEACHGPGSRHLLGGGDPEMILAPSELTTEKENEICAQCHVRVKSVPTGKFGWPRDETRAQAEKSWIPGVTAAPLSDFYTMADGRWPDGIHGKQHHQQNFDYAESSKPTFMFHQVRCTECHSAHRGGKHMIRSRIEEDGIEIPTENDNNTLCLACHATHGDFEEITPEQVAEYEENEAHIAEIVVAHTNHPYAPERRMGLSRCSKCHMPQIAKSAVNYDVHSHTFEAISPEKTLLYQEDGGMPNSCAVSCHSTLVNSFGLGMDPDIGDWDAQFDVDSSEALLEYFGPGGEWWDTSDPESPTGVIMERAPRPGQHQNPTDLDEND